jgi:aryl-alcohol dehydrogenase-like predicted oxidoreductase
VHVDSPQQREALLEALLAGVNLIDTSTNYGGGGSERLVGFVLADAVQRGAVRRDQVVVVSKIGYVQGYNLETVRASEHGYPEIVEYRHDCWHCIHPDFLGDQLELSLDRLGLDRLDVLLLHNPEYFLVDHRSRHGRVDDGARDRFYDRIRRAFEFMEGAVERGRISCYGVSSNRFARPTSDPAHTGLDRMVSIARELAGDAHHFAVAELPMNLYELGAVAGRREVGARMMSVIDVAEAAGVGVLVNRPLNAIVEREGRERLLRLADRPLHASIDGARERLRDLRALESEWAVGLGRELRTEDDDDDAADVFRWGEELELALDRIRDSQIWTGLRETVSGRVSETAAMLVDMLEDDEREEFSKWWQRYGAALDAAFSAVEDALRARETDETRILRARLDALVPQEWRTLPLSRKAILALLSAPISCVLVGMRRPSYVHDVAAIRGLVPVPGPEDGGSRGIDLEGLAAELAQ